MKARQLILLLGLAGCEDRRVCTEPTGRTREAYTTIQYMQIGQVMIPQVFLWPGAREVSCDDGSTRWVLQ